MVSTMSKFPSQIIVFLLMLLCYMKVGESKVTTRCIEAERQALLKIKADLHELKEGFLSSWGNEDEKRECCEWRGVRCANETRHVILLDLSPPNYMLANHLDDVRVLRGKISLSLTELKHLTHLDLSLVDFQGHRIPNFISSLSKLRYLSLFFTSISGDIPPQFSNLSSLEFLNLSQNYDLTIKSLRSVFSLYSLRNLDMSETNLSTTNDWFQVVSKLPHLSNLRLSESYLPNTIPLSLSLVMTVNFSTSLAFLDLSENFLSAASLYKWIFNFGHGLVHLDLSYNDMSGGYIPETLLRNLSTLEYLDLEENELKGVIPDAFGCMTSLSYLSLAYNYLEGSIPEALGNLTSLSYLSLSGNEFEGSIPEALGNLTSLSYLDLHYNELQGSIPEALGNLTSLSHLDLRYNELQGSIPEALGNLTSLSYLDLRYNEFEGSIPEALGNLTSLSYLDLHYNELQGSIPEALGNLTSLTHLDLSYNSVEGDFPKSLWNLCLLSELYAQGNKLSGLQFPEQSELMLRCSNHSLQILDLSSNQIQGSLPNLTLFSSLKRLQLRHNRLSGVVPESIGQLSQLEVLMLSSNSLKGLISEAHFSRLSRLYELYLNDNSLILNISSDWVPPFRLDVISLGSCQLGPQFPKWLQNQKNYSILDISYSGISESIPYWFWGVSTVFVSIDISHNQIHGAILSNSSVNYEDVHYSSTLDLSSNKLEGSIPCFLFQVGLLNLSTNRFSELNSLCKVTDDPNLQFLDISSNQLSGELPNFLSHFKPLRELVLSNNKLSGQIPISIGSLTEIKALYLRNNFFTDKLPSTLKNCTALTVLDVGENRLSGIPIWIGEILSHLNILSLRSNNLSGNIPSSICLLGNLQLLDLSSNNISGTIPRCLGNFTAMKTMDRYDSMTSIAPSPDEGEIELLRNVDAFVEPEVELLWKGKVSKFRSILRLVICVDLSSNKLIGEIPNEITELVGLISLNLSRNNLSGKIPSEIGKLNLLDALDLSNNQLSGAIPSSLSKVDRLNSFDVSNNKLSGEIPRGTQLQSFEVSSYKGNPELCGDPLPKTCPGDELSTPKAPSAPKEESPNVFTSWGFYISIGVGFVVGFWGACASLIFNKTWRFSYFNFFNGVEDWIYVQTAVYKAKILRMIRN